MRLNLRNFAWLLRRSLVATLDDGCLSTAKGAAYSALLSFFPVLTSAATVLVQTRAEFVARTIEDALSEIVPPDSETLVVQQFRIADLRGEIGFGDQAELIHSGGLPRNSGTPFRMVGGQGGSYSWWLPPQMLFHWRCEPGLRA